MEDNLKKIKAENSLLNGDNILKKYIKKDEIIFYNSDNLINKENSENLLCPICYCILKNPKSCSDKKNSHLFCKDCIDQYIQKNNNNKCPLCKLNFEYKNNNEINIKLNKLEFKCLYKNEGCNDIIKYSDYLNHISNCIYNKYICQIKKYNYNTKRFEICGFKSNKKNIENHIKKCAFMEYYCIFCNKNIFKINLEEHLNNNCKMCIINYINGDKYIGGIKNNLREGYGILYFVNGNKYEGEFKNDKKEGYGIYYYNNGNKYECEFKNDKKEGYGILYLINGNRYEGEFKNDLIEGYGIFYFNNGDKYEGEYKNYLREGYGIYYFNNGNKYEGEFKNNLFKGYGKLYLNMKENLKII